MATSLGVVPFVASLGGCASDGGSVGDIASGGDTETTPTSPSGIDLQTGMAIGLGSTAFAGLAGPAEIDPEEPGGGRLVTVDAVDPGERITVSWRRTIERERTPETPPTAGVGEATPTPVVEIVEESGTVTATGLAESHRPFLPMYWRPGPVQTETSAIWLSREVFRELREMRRTAWSADPLTRISRLGEEAVREIERGLAEVDQVYLNAEPDFVDFELRVNGQSTMVQAIAAFDTFGNAYRILDEERNPLILKFTYDAVSTWFAGIDAGLWSLIKTVFSGYRVASIEAP